MDLSFFHDYKKILMQEDDYLVADDFKNRHIPEYLYKYFPCDKSRMSSLLSKRLWLAHRSTFNDSKEFMFMYLDEETFESSEIINENIKFMKNFKDEHLFEVTFKEATIYNNFLKDIISTSCFTTRFNYDYFWNEYADEYNGFCVKYKITDKRLFFPVIYTDERMEVNNLIKTIIVGKNLTVQTELEWLKKKGYRPNIVDNDVMGLLSILYFNYCCKGLKWKDEEEFRIIFANPVGRKVGQLVDYSDLNIQPCKIYIGNQCSEIDKKNLESIAEGFELEYECI